MSTDVDGAPSSVADPDDGDPRHGAPGEARSGSVSDSGSEWVQAEMQRRMAVNRTSRGRHARRATSTNAPDEAPTGPTRIPRSGEHRRPTPPPPLPWEPPVSAADLPENYVPRHSVQTPGPAADPLPPITGPIPVVRPADTPAGGAAFTRGPGTEPSRPAAAPLGGPSLPPTGLQIRRRRSGGPGVPMHGDAAAPPGPWSRPSPRSPRPSGEPDAGGPDLFTPGSPPTPPSSGVGLRPIVPHEPARRLGAPPETLGGPEPIPAWGLPLATPARGLVVPDGGASSPEPGPEPGPQPGADSPADGPDGGDPHDDGPDDDGPDVRAAAVTPAAAPPAPGPTDPDRPAGPPGVPPHERRTDPPTTPHPVLGETRTPSGRLVRVPVQRSGEPGRTLTPRPPTPRSLPVVGAASEPGSARVRVVLSERKGVARTVRTIKEVQEGTPVGVLLRTDLIRSQLRLTLRFAFLTLFVLGALPAVFAYFPQVSTFTVLGMRLPWLVLGVLMYPFLVLVSWRYTRVADRVEQSFADHVQDR